MQLNPPPNSLKRIVILGTYDLGKPRTRILIRGLKENDVDVIQCHHNVWGGIEDKSQVTGLWVKLTLAWKILTAYPVLIFRYLQLPKHDAVLIGYLGLFDVLILWPFVRMRHAVLIWDVFLSLYNTVVEDRELVGRYNPSGILLWLMEWFALRVVDLALMDTDSHANYLSTMYRCKPNKVVSVLVGAEPEKFDLSSHRLEALNSNIESKNILFYGQFIPLHGIDTVVRAAKLTEDKEVQWLIIGKGQEANKIEALINELRPNNLRWIEWVEYDDLIKYLAESHVALGIFGSTEKAKRVIPNKVYQILMAGRPLITADTPAVRELLTNNDNVCLVPAGSPHALAEAICAFPKFNSLKHLDSSQGLVRNKITPIIIGANLVGQINKVLKR